MSEQQAEEIIEALDEPKKRTAKKPAPKAATSTDRARAIVLQRLKNR
jgi:hypothetical protein